MRDINKIKTFNKSKGKVVLNADAKKKFKKGFKPAFIKMLDNKSSTWLEMSKHLVGFRLQDIILEGEDIVLDITKKSDYIDEKVKEFEKFHGNKPALQRMFANAQVYFGFFRFPDIRLRRLASVAFVLKDLIKYENLRNKVVKLYNIDDYKISHFQTGTYSNEVSVMLEYIRKTIPKYSKLIISDKFNQSSLLEQYKLADIIDECLNVIIPLDRKLNPDYYPREKAKKPFAPKGKGFKGKSSKPFNKFDKKPSFKPGFKSNNSFNSGYKSNTSSNKFGNNKFQKKYK